ncbi:stage III sporulation protein AE [Shimazuella sp. AN120528]|uniref:stage III sporulation protein AE n=1 Tax=Shimazuella soli TaxID=1892854 RepID=UPI001F10E7D3|nr:stage III sporulation protein AE [Shimazuella soli]MCH5584181.1 stage III sporulation protein AE [Shimazuella soli]
MVKMFRILLLVVFFLHLGTSIVFATENAQATESNENLIRSQLNKMQLAEVESFWSQLRSSYGQYFKEKDLPSLMELLTNQKSFTWKSVLMAFVEYFFHEVLQGGKLLGSIIVLTVFSMILATLQTAFERNQVSKVAYAIVFMVLIVLAVDSFSVAVAAAKHAIGGMVNFMLALIPLLLALLATMGNISSVTFFHPLIIFMIHVIGTVIYTVVLPLLFFSTILHIVSSLSDKYKVNQLADLLRKVSVGVLGVLLTLFLGVLSVQGATTAVTDGITVRTAKYISGNFVPVVGRTIADATDTVVGASLLVKNSVGLAGVIILLLICAFPALKVLTLSFIYNFSAAIMQPLGNSPIIASLTTIGRTLLYVFAALAAVGLMFFLAITIVITSGNLSMMIRG